MDLVFLLFLLLFRREVAALKLLHINVPPFTSWGESVLLECSYDLESDKLYSLSWYKDHEEFYRYVPKGEPTVHTYHVEGVKVDRRQSDDQRVSLQDVNLHTSGRYKCEVSAEAPLFDSVSDEASMEVVVRPQKDPTITGEEEVYASGDVLALNCTTGKSHPPARIKWFINDLQVKPDTEAINTDQHGLSSTVSSLRLQLQPDHLASDKIKVRCEATMQTSQEVSEPLIDQRNTEVFVQGHASLATPSLCLLAVALLQHSLSPF